MSYFVAVQEFLQSYRTAFERADASEIARHFAYPSHVTSDAEDIGLNAVASAEEWARQLEQLLAAYARMGVATAGVVELAVTELSPRLYHAVVGWTLNDAAGRLLYGFDATYTLANIDSALRITALAHNEIPRLRACLSNRG